MIRFCLVAATLFFLFQITIIMNGQSAQPKLNQIELMKLLAGSWQCETSRDTIEYMQLKSYGTGLEAYKKFFTKDRLIIEGKQLYGYDKKSDKFILSGLFIGLEVELCEMWFTSKNTCIVYPYSDITKCEKAPFQVELEFKSPDIMLYKVIVDNNVIQTLTVSRLKTNLNYLKN